MTNLLENLPVSPLPKPPKEKRIADTVQLNVRLREIMPPIWRRILVPANTNLHKLHWFIQGAMGWEDAHLYKFEINGVEYGVPDPEYEDMEIDMEDSKATLLNQVISGPGHRFTYEYDFGDGWTHDIMVEKIVPGKFSQRFPSCIGGMRACPPEDCGGTHGYEEFLSCIASPRHARYAEMTRWVGKPFDPEAFDRLSTDIAMKRRQHSDDWYTLEPWP